MDDTFVAECRKQPTIHELNITSTIDLTNWRYRGRTDNKYI